MPLFRVQSIGHTKPPDGYSNRQTYQVSIISYEENLTDIINGTSVDSIKDLVTWLYIAAARVQEITSIFGSFLHSLHGCFQAYITVGVRNNYHSL